MECITRIMPELWDELWEYLQKHRESAINVTKIEDKLIIKILVGKHWQSSEVLNLQY